jgi:hypothetical protein
MTRVVIFGCPYMSGAAVPAREIEGGGRAAAVGGGAVVLAAVLGAGGGGGRGFHSSTSQLNLSRFRHK